MCSEYSPEAINQRTRTHGGCTGSRGRIVVKDFEYCWLRLNITIGLFSSPHIHDPSFASNIRSLLPLRLRHVE